MDINYGLFRTKQTFIVELGFLGVHSDEDHQRKVAFIMLFLTFTDSTTWRVSALLVFVSVRHTQIIAFSVKLFGNLTQWLH